MNLRIGHIIMKPNTNKRFIKVVKKIIFAPERFLKTMERIAYQIERQNNIADSITHLHLLNNYRQETQMKMNIEHHALSMKVMQLGVNQFERTELERIHNEERFKSLVNPFMQPTPIIKKVYLCQECADEFDTIDALKDHLFKLEQEKAGRNQND